MCAGNPRRVSRAIKILSFQNFYEVLKTCSAGRKGFFDTLGDSRCTGYLSYCVVPRSTDRCKALLASNDHIVISAGAVDDEQFSVCVPAANDAHMGIIRVEYQVTGLCVRPRNIGAIAVLCGGSAAVADDIAAARLIVEHPIHKPAAIQSVGPVGPRGGTACRRAILPP